MRKLASIQRVLDIRPIENADNIELAKINGWQCVVKKGEFSVGDLGVYIEIDSIPPNKPPFEFLYAKSFSRLRTIKLKGAISQGLLMPFSAFDCIDHDEGDDVTELLSIAKYDDTVISVKHRPEGMHTFPSLFSKTDEPRIQSEPGLLQELWGLPYVCTLKYDGTSATFCNDGEYKVCSRNYALDYSDDNMYWYISDKYDLLNVVKTGMAIQGEICGPGIQGNKLGLTEKQLFVFNVIVDGEYASRTDLFEFCLVHKLKYVEAVISGRSFDLTMDELLEKAEGKYPGTNNEREGFVVRPMVPVYSELLGGNLSFKVISNKFLLKEK